MDSDMIDYKAAAVWPVFVADLYADMLTPNQIGKLYEAHLALHVASDHIDALSLENTKLRDALHDAINRPKGVVPDSAEQFYEPVRALQGEASS